ncbi:uncharacterized protein ARMOST_14942 [Armillaria ostoyae]|uniref:Uncharacterized protein n=1 Tax=Armillaria ostoyae TaxID=47428 RepID=A0A284RS34_ARMOS|nr:uncharacterized protein ARMOST_14942 [Armillaria ostoyae]
MPNHVSSNTLHFVPVCFNILEMITSSSVSLEACRQSLAYQGTRLNQKRRVVSDLPPIFAAVLRSLYHICTKRQGKFKATRDAGLGRS